jgi:hypothetical protein
MRKLQSLLQERETTIDFDHLNHRIRCYAHIINICSSHIISLITSKSKSKSKSKSSSSDSDCITRAHRGPEDSEDESDDSDSDYDDEPDESEQTEPAPNISNPKEWLEGIKRDPLGRARKLVRFLRSSDQRKIALQDMIAEGNDKGYFFTKDSNGKRSSSPVKVPELELLRDVKTRWDSVFLMLRRLGLLRPVSHLADWTRATKLIKCFT